MLCRYGFAVRGLHRLQVDTPARRRRDDRRGRRAGFVLEGTLRQFAWVDGSFADQVILSLLATEWPPADPYPGR